MCLFAQDSPIDVCIFVLVWLLLFLFHFPLVFVQFNQKAISWSPVSLIRIDGIQDIYRVRNTSLIIHIYYKEEKSKLSVEKSGREHLNQVNKKHHQ